MINLDTLVSPWQASHSRRGLPNRMPTKNNFLKFSEKSSKLKKIWFQRKRHLGLGLRFWAEDMAIA